MLSTEILDLIKYENVKHISSKEYLAEDEYAYHVFDTKYCIRWDESGNVITDTSLPYAKIETPADVFWRISSGLASPFKHNSIKGFILCFLPIGTAFFTFFTHCHLRYKINNLHI